MKVIVDGWAWFTKKDLSPNTIRALKDKLTVKPRKVGDHPGEAPSPIPLWVENSTHFGVAREYFLARKQPHHEVEFRVTEGDKVSWAGPIAFEGVLRSEQDTAVKEFVRKFRSGTLGGILRAPPGWGKCTNSLAFLPTTQGLKQISEIVDREGGDGLVEERSDLGCVINNNSRDRITHTYFRQAAETIGILTEWGHRLECTPEHPMLCVGTNGLKWKEFKDITTQDYIAVDCYELDDTPYPLTEAPKGGLNLPEKLTPELARYLGYLAGEGSTIDTNHRSVDKDRFLEWAGCYTTGDHHKQLPWLVRFSGREALRAFVQGYMEMDGKVGEGYIAVTSSSRELLEQLQTVLLGFGVVSLVDVKNGKHEDQRYNYWCLRIDSEFLGQFEKEVGFLNDRKKSALHDEVLSLRGLDRCPNAYGLPFQDLYSDLLYEVRFNDVAVDTDLRESLTRYAAGSIKPSAEKLEELLKALEPYQSVLNTHKGLSDLLDQNRKGRWWVRVSEVYDAGKQKVYDITVDSTHRYLANGLVSHNTVGTCGLIAELQVPTLVIVHKEFLMSQWRERMEQFLPGVRVGIVQQNRCELEDSHVLLSMVQSLASREYEDQLYNWPGLIVTDETHRIGSETWSQVPPKFKSKWRFGISATPKRKDGADKVFLYHIGPVLFNAREKRLPVKVRRVWTTFRLFRTPKYDPAKYGRQAVLKFLCANKERNALIVEQLIEATKAGRKIILLSERLKHLRDLSASFLGTWASPDKPTVGFLVGGMKAEAREISEKAQVIFATYQFAAEGLDIPALDTLFLATPVYDVVQAVGRIQRPCEGKKDPVVVDFIDPLVEMFAKASKSRDKIFLKLGS